MTQDSATPPVALSEWIFQQVAAMLDTVPALPDQLRLWHEASFRKTLAMEVDGKLSPATLVTLLQHDEADDTLLRHLAVTCACMHTAADLVDDCEDDDLLPEIWGPEDRPQAINVTSGLLFLVYQALAALPIDEQRRREVERRFTTAGIAMHVGQHHDLSATNQHAPTDYAHLCELKTGAEIAVFFASAAVALGRDPAAYESYGRALGAIMQATSDLVDVWLLPESPDLMAGKQNLPLSLGLALAPKAVRAVGAGDRRRSDRQRQLRQVLCDSRVLREVERTVMRWIDEVVTALSTMPDEVGLQRLADDIIGQAKDILGALHEAAPQLRKQSRRGTQPLRLPALMLAEQFLTDARTPQDAVEYQRSGLFDRPELVADVFGPAFVSDILAELGHDQSAICGSLMRQCEADGWRYYPEQREIPPDADDLGQLLLLIHRKGGVLPPEVEGAIAEAMQFCQIKGRLPVWLYTSQTLSPPDTWAGDDCPGAIATGVAGLTLLQRPEWQPILTRTVEWLLDARGHDGFWRGFHYFDPHVCTMFVVRGLQAQLPYVPPYLRSRIEAVFDGLRVTLAQSQRLDGGWGSPQATASALTTWLMVDPAPAGMGYAATFLAEVQEFDGGWQAEPLYVTFGHGDRVVTFSSRLMTSALCLRALHRAEQRRREVAGKPVVVPAEVSANAHRGSASGMLVKAEA